MDVGYWLLVHLQSVVVLSEVPVDSHELGAVLFYPVFFPDEFHELLLYRPYLVPHIIVKRELVSERD